MMDVMIQTAFLVIAILAVQKLFGNKLHAYVRYSLWLLVVLRLIIPVNFINSPFSMLRFMGTVPQLDIARLIIDLPEAEVSSDRQADSINDLELSIKDIWQSASTEQDAGNDMPVQNIGNVEKTDADNILSAESIRQRENDAVWRADATHIQSVVGKAYLFGTIIRILQMIWLIGSLIVGGFLLSSHIRFRRKLCRTRVLFRNDRMYTKDNSRLPIYCVENLETPCLIGFIRPAVYISANIDTVSDDFRYAVTHEVVHYMHLDHIWALVRAVLVTVYWFHPFVWIAAVYSIKDGEIACDYGTVCRIGLQERFAYGEMLLRLSQTRRGNKVYTFGAMLRPGKSELKNRILHVTSTGTNRAWAGILAVFIMIILVGCAFTGESDISGGKTFLLVNEAGKASTDTGADEADGENTGINEEDLPETDEPRSNYSRGIEPKAAEVSGETLCGADGPHLDYAGRLVTSDDITFIFRDIIILHDYFGLIVYDLGNGDILRSLDLASIGCNMTQGDDACQVAVSADGQIVWLHPMSKDYMYRYEVEGNLLYQESIAETFEKDLEDKELFDHYMTTEDEAGEAWHSNYLYEEYKDEQGLHNAYIYLWASNDSDASDITDYKLTLRNLRCTWDDMVFILFEDGIHTQDNIDGFPYRYDGGVEDIAIIYDEPCVYTRISDVFGERTHPLTGEVIVHDGIDFAADEGTDITAAADGIVYETGYSAKYGNYVVLLHINGDMTYYCQCREITAKEGKQVKRGEKIASVGSTGMSTGSHLHFALSRDGVFVNPQDNMEDILSHEMN